MKLGGLQKHTLIDFPGNIACTVFTVGCNFKCPFCHNPELVIPSSTTMEEGNIDTKKFFEFLKTRKGLLDGVVITGGEPCIQPDLVEFCIKIKAMGFKIKLDTNGTMPHTLELLFRDKLVDYVAMDIKSSPAQYFAAAGTKFNLDLIPKSIKLIMDNAPDYEFRTTCVKSLINEKIVKDIGKMINNAKLYILQPCTRSTDVLNPEFIKKQDGFFSKKELSYLKDIVENYVDKCELR